MYVNYMIILYCHEQEKIRGRVSGRQVLGSLSDEPQVGGAYQVFDFCFQCCTSRFEGLGMLTMPQYEHRNP